WPRLRTPGAAGGACDGENFERVGTGAGATGESGSQEGGAFALMPAIGSRVRICARSGSGAGELKCLRPDGGITGS
ncbi:MAG: hypothetical protein ACREA9_24165, partial [Pyrinomonadaceae bacterium]